MSEKQLETEKVTALYERLFRDDEQIADSNSIVNHELVAYEFDFSTCMEYNK